MTTEELATVLENTVRAYTVRQGYGAGVLEIRLAALDRTLDAIRDGQDRVAAIKGNWRAGALRRALLAWVG